MRTKVKECTPERTNSGISLKASVTALTYAFSSSVTFKPSSNLNSVSEVDAVSSFFMTSVSFNSRTTSLAFSDTCESVVVSSATATGLLLRSVTIGFGSTAALSVDVVAPLVFSVGVPVVPPPIFIVSVVGLVATGFVSFAITILPDSFGAALPSVGLDTAFESVESVSAAITCDDNPALKTIVPTMADAKPTPLNLRNE